MVKIRFKRSTNKKADESTSVPSASTSHHQTMANIQSKSPSQSPQQQINQDQENQSSDATSQKQNDTQKQTSHILGNFFMRRRNRSEFQLRATLYGLNGECKTSSWAAARQYSDNNGNKISQQSSSASNTQSTSSINDKKSSYTPKPSSSSSAINSSSHKNVLPTIQHPSEMEVTEIDGTYYLECPLCVLLVDLDSMPNLQTCDHRTCLECMQRYLKTEINHSRLNITCPTCSEPLAQNVIKDILKDDKFYAKYESFMLRKVLAAEPDARWCPAPDCSYAVLANGCASCPRLVCGRKGCNTAFCYHCKQEWHPDQTCSSASIQRNNRGLVLDSLNIGLAEQQDSNQTESNRNSNGDNNIVEEFRKSSKSGQQATSLKLDDIKECPVCSSRIIKMNDGSCNHMTCSICETEFCWLCMKEINDLHYFSPSGCTFWGKKPWSRKKKLLWRLGMLVGAPICIIFIAGIAVPAIVIGIPVWAARKLHTRLERKKFSKYRKNAIITGGVLLSFVVSPIISVMALAIGVPILLGYVYGFVPLSLCRSSGGCLSATASVESIPQQYQPQNDTTNNMSHLLSSDVNSIGAPSISHKLGGNPSIGETSLYLSNISLETNSVSHMTNVERGDRESASNAGMAGSIMSTIADDGNSTKALAGSIISKDSGGCTLIPAEIHNSQQQ